MSLLLRWNVDGQDWPNRDKSRFIRAGGLMWHVQVAGRGPALLLLHGTGAATHSWRDLLPLLAERFTVVAPDLPGHGFTAAPPRRLLSMDGMARLLGALLRALDIAPSLGVGHSAGAAILARMTADRLLAPRALAFINGALLPIEGPAAQLFPAAARLLVRLPPVPWLFALRAGDDAMVSRLIGNTGSQIDARGMQLYARLARDPGHVAAALGMMARWDLAGLLAPLARLQPPVLLLAGGRDRMIRPSDAERLSALLPHARSVLLPMLGHLAHEEQPQSVAERLIHFAAMHEIVPADSATAA